MTDKNPLVVEPGQVVFEDTGTGKKPDTLDGVFISPEALGNSDAAIESTAFPADSLKRVVESIEMLLNTFPDKFKLRFSDIALFADLLVPEYLTLSFAKGTESEPCNHRFRIPNTLNEDFMKPFLTRLYGDYIFQTDILKQMGYPKVNVVQTAAHFIPELIPLSKLSSESTDTIYAFGMTDRMTICNPYLSVLMLPAPLRSFVAGAISQAELDGTLQLPPTGFGDNLNMIFYKNPLTLKDVLKYGQKVGQTELNQYFEALSKLPLVE